MSDEAQITQTNKPGSTPVITTEIAAQLAKEGEALRRAYRRRLREMWNISSAQRQTRAR